MICLGVSGSLRASSTNRSLLQALQLASSPHDHFLISEQPGLLPLFNPDEEAGLSALPLERWRAELQQANTVIFSTPEYAHGMPGMLKNALDWVVGSGELSEKPVVLANASARGTYAQESLREVLATMNARVLRDAELTLELAGRKLTPAQIVADAGFGPALVAFL